MRKKNLAALLLPVFLLSACEAPEDTAPSTDVAPGPEARFSPLTNELPRGSDIFFATSTDETLNIPSSSPLALAANELDGWSTVAPITTRINDRVDPNSLVAGDTVRVFSLCINPLTKRPTGPGPDGELIPGRDYVVSVSAGDPTGQTIAVKPTRPLREMFDDDSAVVCPDLGQGALNKGNAYLVVLSKGLLNSQGEEVVASRFYDIAKGPDCLAIAATDTPEACPGADPQTGLTPAGVAAGLTPSGQNTVETLRRLTNGLELLAAGISAQTAPLTGLDPVNPADIILSFSFSPQAVSNTLKALAATTVPQPMGASFIGLRTDQLNPALPGLADVYAGTLNLPYYLFAPSQENPAAPLNTFWLADADPTGSTTFVTPLPKQNSMQTVPLLMTIPSEGRVPGFALNEGDKLPVVIFQHGITRNRADMLALADSLSLAGLAVVAIDLPLHGITPHSSLAGLRIPNVGERTFDVDFEANEPDGDGNIPVVDESGTHFINLPSLLTSRDNLRQGAADLMTLLASLPNASFQRNGVNFTFDPERIYFVGHSLGAIVGTTFLGVSEAVPGPDVKAASLVAGGGGIAKLLDASAAFGPRIAAGLAAQGVLEGTSDYEAFLQFAQQTADAGDPLNYGARAAAAHPIHFIEVIGDATHNPDAVVPNNAFEPLEEFIAPPGVNLGENVPVTGLGGTDPLVAAMGLTSITQTSVDPDGLRAVVCFARGTHGAVLQPDLAGADSAADALAITVEMQTQIATFLASNGLQIPINSDAVVACN